MAFRKGSIEIIGIMVVLFSVLFVADNITGYAAINPKIPTPLCSDSDGGNEIYTAGCMNNDVCDVCGTRNSDGSFTEISGCIGSNCTLFEVYCTDTYQFGSYWSDDVYCPYGCLEGACNPEPVACYDPGASLTSQDSCSDATGKKTEYCINDYYLNELGCKDNLCRFVPYYCPKYGYDKCVNGVCVNTTNPIPVCSDSDGGKYYYTYGYVEITTGDMVGVGMDSCVDRTVLNERYCFNSTTEAAELFSCPNGCSDGVCELSGYCGDEYCDSINGIFIIDPNAAIPVMEYRGKIYDIEILNMSSDPYHPGVVLLKVDGVQYQLIENYSNTLADGTEITATEIFVSTKESTPDSCRIYIGPETPISCYDDCVEVEVSSIICGDGICDSTSNTLIAGMPENMTYGGITYTVSLLNTTDLPTEATALVNVNGVSYFLYENKPQLLPSEYQIVATDIFSSTKESTPDSARLHIGPETIIDCQYDCGISFCGDGICENKEKMLLINVPTTVQYKNIIYNNTLLVLAINASGTAEAVVNINGNNYTFVENEEGLILDGVPVLITEVFIGTKESTPNSTKIVFDENYINCNQDCVNLNIPSCEDSDGGINYYELGSVYVVDDFGFDYEKIDNCLDNATLTEYSCDGLELRTTYANCICNEGVCISNATTVPIPVVPIVTQPFDFVTLIMNFLTNLFGF